ncbi:MAG: DEAD/DEAH box helicase [Lentisphaeria bacterium]
MSFSELNLPNYIQQAVACYPFPTAIQKQAIPQILAGNDLLAQAQTGTGKTAAFVLPILTKLSQLPPKKKKISVLSVILAPTRELVLQVTKSAECYGRFLPKKLKVLPIIGGEDIKAQITALRHGVDIVVATPGRLLELAAKGEIRLVELAFLVIDEADKMLDLGFAQELENLLQLLPKKRQNLFFSATFSNKVTAIAEKILVEPFKIMLENNNITATLIQQRIIEVDADQRGMLLRHLIKNESLDHVLVFVASKRAAANLATKLNKVGVKALDFHGNLTQDERIEVLNRFKNRNVQVLIATDIAARGIDISKLAYVVNFDLPRAALDYVHRIGRTGRAGEVGHAITFVSYDDQAHLSQIEKVTKNNFIRERIDGFTYTQKVKEKVEAKKGRRPNKKDKAREKLTS